MVLEVLVLIGFPVILRIEQSESNAKLVLQHWELSDEYDIMYGTPQGSGLGPLLFSIFTNDLHKHLLYVKCILFADNTTLYMSHRNRNYLSWCIEQDLQIITDWFRANLLTLNEVKSVCMTFNTNGITGSNMTTGCNI